MYDVFIYADKVGDNGQLLIHFDAWSSTYDYWTEPTTKDIHPIGWFDQCGHKYPQYKQQLQPPKGKNINIFDDVCYFVD